MKGGTILLIIGLLAAAVVGYFLLAPTAKKDGAEGNGGGASANNPVTGSGGNVYKLEGESLGDFIARRSADGWKLDTRLFKGEYGIWSS